MIAVAIVVFLLLVSIGIPTFTSVNTLAPGTKSLQHAKHIRLACVLYANDNNGRFPPSLDALYPDYLQDRQILISPLSPGTPIGYTYTPGLTETSPTNSLLIEDKFAPTLKQKKIVVYVNGEGCVLDFP